MADWQVIRLRPYDIEAVQEQIEGHNKKKEGGVDEHTGNIVEVGNKEEGRRCR